MDTITKGRLGYNLVEKKFLQEGYELYVPVLENTKIDCIACKNGYLIKFQIKTLGQDQYSKFLPVRKISHNQGQYKVHLYSKDEIDYFIGVDLDNEDIYIVPIEITSQYSSRVSISKLQSYKNNFAQLEPLQENLLSADDDIGENQYDVNTEGMQYCSPQRVDNRPSKLPMRRHDEDVLQTTNKVSVGSESYSGMQNLGSSVQNCGCGFESYCPCQNNYTEGKK